MKHVSPQVFLEGIALPGVCAKFPRAFENAAPQPIVVDSAAIAAAAIVQRSKRGAK